MILHRIILSCLIMVVCVIPACKNESKCNLTLDNAPALIGLRLGISVDEVKAKIPGLFVTNLDGGRAVAQLQNVYVPSTHVEGVEDAEFEFLDGKLYSLEVKYDRSTEWEEYEFVVKVEEKLGLKSEWVKVHGSGLIKPNMWECECNGFNILITEPGISQTSMGPYRVLPTIKIEDTTAARRAHDRWKDTEENKRREGQGNFSP